jgi:endonuclease III
MKNSRHYSSRLQKLFRLLKREYGKVRKVSFDEPIDAVIQAILSETMMDSGAQSSVRKLAAHFVDWNDLRVSRPDEILDVIGKENGNIRNTISTLTRALYAVFKKYDIVSLKLLKGMGKRSARQALSKLEAISPFVCDYVMLTALQGHAIPLNAKMTEYLKEQDFVHPDASETEIQGFLSRQIPATKAYEFYSLLHRESEKGAVRAKIKSTDKRETKRKSASKAKRKSKKAPISKKKK